ncbi:MAG: T9SS type A sorting domain-containing protein [Candidatus Marinimicrobia bacterium]|nr:T9SS type A sorting domain-containing protein [Candidatus Neomarinimicrobiota bacterium]
MHPNPFNPVTNISYSLPVSGDVTLIIYNLLGEEVARLVDGFQPAGEYNTTWNASNIASGIYFYRLRSGNVVQTRKMVLLK